jgi:hypothetical protein
VSEHDEWHDEQSSPDAEKREGERDEDLPDGRVPS